MGHFSMNVVSRGIACLLAMLVLLTPVCDEWCRSKACGETSAAAEKSPCHEMAGSGSHDAADGSIHAVRTCGLQQFPAVLQLNSRELAPRLEAANASRGGDRSAIKIGWLDVSPIGRWTRHR